MKTFLIIVVIYLGRSIQTEGFLRTRTTGIPLSLHFHRVSSKIASTSSDDINFPLATSSDRIRKGTVPEFALPNDNTIETPFQRLVVGTHFLLAAINLSSTAVHLTLSNPSDFFSILLTIIFAVVLGDLGTGKFHWAVDNYGFLETPIFGSVCAAFQGHHKTPWTITFRSFANNVYKIGFGTIPVLVGLLVTPSIDPLVRLFSTLFVTFWMLSQELHKYAHMRQSPSPLIKSLQDRNIILTRKEHGLHHNSPYEGHYCILTGMCNPFLDRTHFFRRLEKTVFYLTGNRPIVWDEDPNMEKLAMSL